MSLVSSDMNQTTPEKAIPAKSDKPRVAELKNGKIIFRQKPITFENHSETMQEIVTFRGVLEASEVPLTIIPEQHLPLIAKLVHESDKTLNALTKSLQSSLVPPILGTSQESDSKEAPTFLPASTIEHAIKTVADRANYGIVTDGDKLPAALCVWRWEVKNPEWLPKSVIEKAAARVKERISAKEHLQSVFDDLSADDKEAILKTGKQNKLPKEKEVAVEPNAVDKQASHSPTPEHRGEDLESSGKKPGRPKKPVDPETIAKEKEKQEKKAVKAEKDKKAVEATKRSAAAFANFFKPAANPSKSLKGQSSTTAQASSSTSSTSENLSDFQAAFKPFVLKKDSQLAPVNWFIEQRKRGLQGCSGGTGKNSSTVIELDTEGQEVMAAKGQCALMDVDSQDNVSNQDPEGLLRSFLDSKTPSLSLPHRRGRSVKPPSRSQPGFCVRELMNQLVEAEVQGDQRTVRRLNGLLKNRRKIPTKVFVFAENNRPGYLGTWTKHSPTIGPRTPFARDLLSFDYDHDSDAEWEEEEGGDDVESQDESMEDDMSSVGSDMDGWLVEGDEIDVEPMGTTSTSLPESNTIKRKTPDLREPPNKKRKVVPLIPFQKGPIWEKEIGYCEYEPFRPMGIQLLNDTPFPLDPFAFVSEPAILEKKKDTEAVFVLPALPGHLLSTHPEPSAEDARSAKRKAAASQPPPKTTFPDAHIPTLLLKIAESNTSSFVVLLDTLFQDLKSLGIKKNALEVKLREVAEKDKVKKSWVVKEDAWTKNGLVKPTT